MTDKEMSDVFDKIAEDNADGNTDVLTYKAVIKYAQKYNNSKREINNYLQNKGLQRAEILAAWKQYRFNPGAISDLDFKSMIGKKGKLIDMAIIDPEHVQPFD